MIQNPKLKWVLPGPVTELWVDNYVIVKNAPDLDNAYSFLNYQLREDVQIASTKFIGFPSALDGLEEKLPAETQLPDMIFGGKDVDFSKLVSFILNPKTVGVYLKVQSQVQAAAG